MNIADMILIDPVPLILTVCLIIAGFCTLGMYIRHRMIMLAKQLNGRLEEFIETAKKLARAEGVAEGTATEKALHPQ